MNDKNIPWTGRKERGRQFVAKADAFLTGHSPGQTGRGPLHAVRALLALAAGMLAGAGIWYIAITGLVGRKNWNPSVHGVGPLTLAICGGTLLAGTLICFFTLPALKPIPGLQPGTYGRTVTATA